MVERTYPGDTISKTFTFTDEVDALFDPDAITVLILDVAGATVETQAITDLTRSSKGIYLMVYTLPSDAAVGNWNIKVTATYGGLSNEEDYPFTVYPSPTIPYVVVDKVKKILQIQDADGSKYDNEIADCIVDAAAFVDGLLLQQGLTSPSPSPRNILTATNYFAAWMFRKRRDVQSAWIFFTDAERFLNAYVDGYLISNPSSDNDLPIAIGNDTS